MRRAQVRNDKKIRRWRKAYLGLASRMPRKTKWATCIATACTNCASGFQTCRNRWDLRRIPSASPRITAQSCGEGTDLVRACSTILTREKNVVRNSKIPLAGELTRTSPRLTGQSKKAHAQCRYLVTNQRGFCEKTSQQWRKYFQQQENIQPLPRLWISDEGPNQGVRLVKDGRESCRGG